MPSAVSPCELHAERRDHTLVLTISHPALGNTLSEQVFAAGIEALDVAEADASVQCVVLRGDGGHFSAGGQLQHFGDFVEALRVFPKPVIACVEGAADAGGFSLALACDLIVAAEDTQFMMSYGRAGHSLNGSASWQLMQRVPRGLVLQWLWLSESLTAQQLHAHGIVNWIAGKGQALVSALDIADRLARCPPNTIASAKELVNQWPTQHPA